MTTFELAVLMSLVHGRRHRRQDAPPVGGQARLAVGVGVGVGVGVAVVRHRSAARAETVSEKLV